MQIHVCFNISRSSDFLHFQGPLNPRSKIPTMTHWKSLTADSSSIYLFHPRSVCQCLLPIENEATRLSSIFLLQLIWERLGPLCFNLGPLHKPTTSILSRDSHAYLNLPPSQPPRYISVSTTTITGRLSEWEPGNPRHSTHFSAFSLHSIMLVTCYHRKLRDKPPFQSSFSILLCNSARRWSSIYHYQSSCYFREFRWR